jgi:hypothetical protein
MVCFKGCGHPLEYHNFEVLARKKKTTTMEFWKKTMNKKSTTLGALGALEKTMKKMITTLGTLEKSRKKKTMALRVWPRRRPWLWEVWKKP